MKNMSMSNVNPLVLFWLGLLTGALVVGLVFFYKALTPADYQDATLYLKSYGTTSKSLDLKSSISPGMYDTNYSISPGM